jgi:endo-1,3-1,4-beta-glycanase ExoK
LVEAPDPAAGYSCGEVQTRQTFGYGTYEVRMRTMEGSGFNAAFFTYIGPVHDKPHDEIDVEILLRDTDRVTFNTYVEGTPANGGDAALAGAGSTDFQHYAFTWDASGIRWFVNGEQVHRTIDGTPRPSEEQKIYASLWGSETFVDWMGPFDAGAVPMQLEIDWIAFTRLGEPCAFPQSVLCADDQGG